MRRFVARGASRADPIADAPSNKIRSRLRRGRYGHVRTTSHYHLGVIIRGTFLCPLVAHHNHPVWQPFRYARCVQLECCRGS